MVGNVTIQGQIVGTATFDGAKISAVVTIAPPINATVNFGGGISTIEQLPEPVSDSSNIYTWIRGTLLTGLDALSDVAIYATDTILQGFAKLQGQLNAVKVRLGLLEDNIIYETVLQNDVASLSISRDKLGNEFSLKEIGVEIVTKGGSVGDRTAVIRINGYISTYRSGSNFSITGFITYINDNNSYSLSKLSHNSQQNRVSCVTNGQRDNSATTTASFSFIGYTLYNSISQPINTVSIVPISGLLKAGTVIRLIKP